MIHDSYGVTNADRALRANHDENGIDIIYVTHTLAEVPTYYAEFTRFYSFFYSKNAKRKFSEKFPDYDIIKSAMKYVNVYRLKYGKNPYPDFTRVDVDIDTYKVKLINFDQKKLQQLQTKWKTKTT